MNRNQEAAIEWLKLPDRKRMIYEGGGPSGRSGSGLYYVDYTNGKGPTLVQIEVRDLEQKGLISRIEPGLEMYRLSHRDTPEHSNDR